MGRTLITVLCASVLLTIGITTDEQLCPSSQILELGENGIIRCSFPNGYFGIYWYDTQDLTQQPLLHSEDGKKGGNGLGSGGFDLAPDGSLLVNLVTIDLERMFTVVLLESHQSQNLIQHTISVRVFAHPALPYPVIIQCTNRQYCYTELRSDDKLECTVNDARPPVHLSWVVRTSEGDSDVSFQRTYSTNGNLSTTTATIGSQNMSTLHFQLFVCKAKHNTLILDNLASFVIASLYQPGVIVIQLTTVVPVFGDLLTLDCDGDDILYFIWKKAISEIKYDVIAHGYITAGTDFSKPPYILDHGGTLVIRHVSQEENGVYICYSSNGIQENIASYNVTIAHLVSTTIITTGIGTVQVIAIQNKSVSATLIPIVAVTLMVAATVLLLIVRRRRRRESDHESQIEKSPTPTAVNEEDERLILDENVDTQQNETRESVGEKESFDESEERPLMKNDIREEYKDTDSRNSDHIEEALQTDISSQDSVKQMNNKDRETEEIDHYIRIEDEQAKAVKANAPNDKDKQSGQSEPCSGEVDKMSNKHTSVEQAATTSICIIGYNNIETQLEGLQLRKYKVGDHSKNREEKVILFLGEREANKCKIINYLINYFHVVNLEGNIRYELEREQVEDQHSYCIVNCINICTSNTALEFDITILDLPHLIDNCETNEPLRYEQLTECIHHLTTCRKTYQLKRVDAIVFARNFSGEGQSSHDILRIFSKNMCNKLHAFTTVDSYDDFITAVNISDQAENRLSIHGGYYLSDNKLLSGISKENLDTFSDHLKSSDNVSMKNTIDILTIRRLLAKDMSAIQISGIYYANNCETVSAERAILTKLKLSYSTPYKVKLNNEEIAMVCTKCKNTCHFPCNESVYYCSAMKKWSLFNGCNVCKANCSPGDHKKRSYRYKSEDEKSTEIEDQKSKIEKAESAMKETENNAKNVHSYLKKLRRTAIVPTVLYVDGNLQNMMIREITNTECKWEDFSLQMKKLKINC